MINLQFCISLSFIISFYRLLTKTERTIVKNKVTIIFISVAKVVFKIAGKVT